MSISISKVANLVDGQLVLPTTNTVELKITSASTLETATGGAITLVDSVERLPSLTQSEAAAAIVPTGA